MLKQSKQAVGPVTKRIIKKWSYQLDSPSTKATLAKIRKTLGKPLDEATDIWPILFENLPEEFVSSYQQPSYEELAIYTAIQCYALHQQGTPDSVMLEEVEAHRNIGSAFAQLRKRDDTTTIDRRFNVMITSSTFEELVYHLRHMLMLLRTKAPGTRIDYAKLAEDLYWFLKNAQENVRLNWARSYYRQYKGEKNYEN